MMWFDAFRKDRGPTQYAEKLTPVTYDVVVSGFLYASVILSLSVFSVLPGFKERQVAFAFLRMTIGIFVLTSIVLCNYGQEWEVATIDTYTQYRAGLHRHIKARIGVKIGLHSINVTLLGIPERQRFFRGLVNETINYNERFGWDNEAWIQGRMGFGPHAGKFNQAYRTGQLRGLPYPILWVAEYFTIDGEGIRWGRHYRQAGFFAYALMWTAFCCWFLTMALITSVQRYLGCFSLLTGSCLLASNIIYAYIHNPTDLEIPFEDAVLTFRYGWCFHLCLVNGVLCSTIGIIILCINLEDSTLLAVFFVPHALEEVHGKSSGVEVTVSVMDNTATTTPEVQGSIEEPATAEIPQGQETKEEPDAAEIPQGQETQEEPQTTDHTTRPYKKKRKKKRSSGEVPEETPEAFLNSIW